MELLKDETLEDLQCGGLKLIQKKSAFRFGLDSVLLSDFAKDIPSKKTLDLCCGSAVIPILMSHKTNTTSFFGIEVQKEIFETSKRSIKLNNLEEKIFLTCGDLKNAPQIYGKRQFDLITCNPPYMPLGSAIKNPSDTKVIARHEVLCNLEDIISVSSSLLKFKGQLAIVHKPTRLVDIIFLMRKYEIEPKRIRFVHKSLNKEPSLVLVSGAFKGGTELRIMPPLYLYNDDGSYTKELEEVYKG